MMPSVVVRFGAEGCYAKIGDLVVELETREQRRVFGQQAAQAFAVKTGMKFKPRGASRRKPRKAA